MAGAAVEVPQKYRLGSLVAQTQLWAHLAKEKKKSRERGGWGLGHRGGGQEDPGLLGKVWRG